jgi:hypothetical protein
MVQQVFITVTFGQIINEKNLLEMGCNGFMLANQNPFLLETIFLEKETYLQAFSIVGKEALEVEQTYLTDPSFRGMLSLSTFNEEGEEGEPVTKITTLPTVRDGKEKILDEHKQHDRTLSFRFPINPTTTKLLEHFTQVYGITIISDFSPQWRGGENYQPIRYGTINANILTDEEIDTIIQESTMVRDFFLMRVLDQQGRRPEKTYFSVDMREFSKHDQGMAVLTDLVKEKMECEVSFFPITGTKNRYWVMLGKVASEEVIKELLKDTNKIFTGDNKYQINAFASFSLRGSTIQVIKPIGGESKQQMGGQLTRRNMASVLISGWPYQVEAIHIRSFLDTWGIQLDPLDKLDFFHGSDAEGYTLRIQTLSLPKARAILQLHGKEGFDFEVSEMSNVLQKNLRLIATTPNIPKETLVQRFPKPTIFSILTDKQKRDIGSVRVNHSHPPPLHL